MHFFHWLSSIHSLLSLTLFVPWKRFLILLIPFSLVEHLLMVLRSNTSTPQKSFNLLPLSLGWDLCYRNKLWVRGPCESVPLWPLFETDQLFLCWGTLYHVTCETLVPWPWIKPRPWQWKFGVLTTGLLGSSQNQPTLYEGLAIGLRHKFCFLITVVE